MMFTGTFDSQPFAIITNRLFDSEWDFLQYAIRSSGNQILYWNPSDGTPYLENGQIVLVNGFSENAVSILRDWMIDISIVGRLDEPQVNFLSSTDVVSYWNLEKYSLKSCIAHIASRAMANDDLSILLWTGSGKLNTSLVSLFKFYHLAAMNSGSPEMALLTLEEKDYDILVLDWDYNGLDIYRIIKELKKLREQKTRIPLILGIKDFDKPDIFKDLSLGIKDYCPVLFTPGEVWELFLRSLPMEEESPLVLLDSEAPLLQKKAMKDGGGIGLEYKKESRILKAQNYASWNELEKMSFRRQFEWIKINP